MARTPARVVLDTNILVSAIVFGGKPRQILLSILENEIQAVTSNTLLAELIETLSKKFKLSLTGLRLVEKQIRQNFKFIQPVTTISFLKDDPDNRVLEAASESNCHYIITGDKELLALASFKHIKIVTAGEFLKRI